MADSGAQLIATAILAASIIAARGQQRGAEEVDAVADAINAATAALRKTALIDDHLGAPPNP